MKRFIPCIGVLLLCMHTPALSEEVVVYAVQSGIIDDSSCCNPSAYQDSGTTYLSAITCQDFGIYGCGQSRRRVAWRFDIADAVPEGFEISSAAFTWNHPQTSSENYCSIYIDADNQVLSSSYCSAMRSNGDMMLLSQSYTGSQISYELTPGVLAEGLAGGYVCTQISSSAQQGVSYINSGVTAPRIIISGTSPFGACCLSNGYCAQLPQTTCENGTDTTFHGPGSTCGTDNACPSEGCDGDLDGDGRVDVVDLLSVISAWGPCVGCDVDIDGDGSVGVTDLLGIIDNWGTCE